MNSTYKDNIDLYCTRQVNIYRLFRELWMNQIIWLRSMITSVYGGLGDVSQVTGRLFRTPDEFEELFRRFYGIENAEKIASLIRQQLLITATLMNDQLVANDEAYLADTARWFENADNIAMFLAQLNPFWNGEIWRQLFADYFHLLEISLASRFKGQYELEIANFDKLHEHVMKMADYMAEGIKKQFNI